MNFKEFLKSYLPAKPGKIKDVNTGKVLGSHDGLMYYTLGQRKGLGIGGQKNGTGEAYFVCGKDLKTNELLVSQGEQDILFSNALVSGKVNWIPKKPDKIDFECYAKFRYRQPEQKVHVHINEDNTTLVTFHDPQRAVTPGQYVVFYNDEYCLGGAVIENVIKNKN